jgi:hypothetical protein
MLDLSANKVGGTIPSLHGSSVALDHFNFSSNTFARACSFFIRFGKPVPH